MAEKVAYDHPVLEPILRESYGIFLYQEQVMRVAMEMCGFTRGEADVLRKAMGKKKADVMQQRRPSSSPAPSRTQRGRTALSKHIWDQIVTFAGYGFNKSHSAAYAVVTFQTAYLRANYPTYLPGRAADQRNRRQHRLHRQVRRQRPRSRPPGPPRRHQQVARLLQSRRRPRSGTR
jgi:DNA polymerase III alpha subunit